MCSADEICQAYHFHATTGCSLGKATKLVGASPSFEDATLDVYINAALVPGRVM